MEVDDYVSKKRQTQYEYLAKFCPEEQFKKFWLVAEKAIEKEADTRFNHDVEFKYYITSELERALPHIKRRIHQLGWVYHFDFVGFYADMDFGTDNAKYWVTLRPRTSWLSQSVLTLQHVSPLLILALLLALFLSLCYLYGSRH